MLHPFKWSYNVSFPEFEIQTLSEKRTIDQKGTLYTHRDYYFH